jgi:hypothetical protein
MGIGSQEGHSLLFHILSACRECKGSILPTDFQGCIGSLLSLGSLTIKYITSVNPKMDAASNLKSIQNMLQDIEAAGNVPMGRMRDFRNYMSICRYTQGSTGHVPAVAAAGRGVFQRPLQKKICQLKRIKTGDLF